MSFIGSDSVFQQPQFYQEELENLCPSLIFYEMLAKLEAFCRGKRTAIQERNDAKLYEILRLQNQKACFIHEQRFQSILNAVQSLAISSLYQRFTHQEGKSNLLLIQTKSGANEYLARKFLNRFLQEYEIRLLYLYHDQIDYECTAKERKFRAKMLGLKFLHCTDLINRAHQRSIAYPKDCKDKFCGKCGRSLTLLKQKNENFYQELEEGEIPRSVAYYSEFVDQIDWDYERGRVRVCYICHRLDLSEAYSERDFSQNPLLKRITTRQQNYCLMLGNIHSYIDNNKGKAYFHLFGNPDFKVYDGQLQMYLAELSRKDNWWKKLRPHERTAVEVSIDYLKSRNHLFKMYYCNMDLYNLVAGRVQLRQQLLGFTSDARLQPVDGINFADVFDVDLECADDKQVQRGVLVSENEDFYLFPLDVEYNDRILSRRMQIEDVTAMSAFRIEDLANLNIHIYDQRPLAQEGDQNQPLKNRVYYSNAYVEEMLFPALFETGKGGYNNCYMQTGLTLKQYAKMRLLLCRTEFRLNTDYIFWLYDRVKKEEIISFNRGVKYLKPGEYDFALKQKDVMKEVMGVERLEYFGKKFSYKHVDTPTYWQKKWYELRRVIQYFKDTHQKPSPDLFITLTLNDQDPELIRIKKHKYSLRDPVASVCFFYSKARQALKQIYGGSKHKQSLFGRAIGYFEKLEPQVRGAPHLHVLLWLDEEGTRLVNEGKVVKATFSQDQVLNSMIEKYQMHKCYPERCFKNRKIEVCKFGYPQPLVDRDCVSGNRWIYRRIEERERTIAPYNPQLLKFFNANVCVMRMTESDITQYLVKYISKTSPEIELQLKFPSEDKMKKSVVSYLKNRQVSSCTAVWNLLGLQMVNSRPHVQFVDINLPPLKGKILKDKEELQMLDQDSENLYVFSILDRYYQRPDAIYDITFFEFIEKWNYTLKPKNIPKGIFERGEYYLNKEQRVYYFKRGTPIVIQPRKWYPQDGEVYYYSLLLERVPHKRHNVKSHTNKSGLYMEECFIKGIIQDDSDESQTRDFWRNNSLNKKQMYQVLTRLLQAPHIDDFQKFKMQKHASALVEFIEEDNENLDLGLKEDRLSQEQRELSQQVNQELSNLKLFEDELNYNPLLVPTLLLSVYESYLQRFSPDQQFTLDFIYDKIRRDEQCLVFITGGAGVGKSFMIQQLRVFLEYGLNLNVELAATTGTVASQINGQTLHSIFRLRENQKNASVEPYSPFQVFLENIDVLIIDEVSLLSELAFNLLELTLKNGQTQPQHRYSPFGGKHIILVGDLLQLPPVGQKYAQLQPNSFIQHEVFQRFNWIVLEQNFRQCESHKFQRILNKIRVDQIDEEVVDALKWRECQKGHLPTDYCEITSQDSMVITALNRERQVYNQSIKERNFQKEELREFHSIDMIQHYDLARALDHSCREDLKLIRQADKNSKTLKSSVEVAIGMKMMLLKNINVSLNQTNGSLLLITDIAGDGSYLQVQNLQSSDKQIQFIGQSEEEIQINDTKIRRRQFPLTMAYACTIHKVQGLTLKHYFIDCKNLFADGHFYTALSRGQSLEGVHLLNLDTTKIQQNHYLIEIYEKKKGNQEYLKQRLDLDDMRMNTLIQIEKAIYRYPQRDIDKVARALGRIKQKHSTRTQSKQKADVEMAEEIELSDLLEGLDLNINEGKPSPQRIKKVERTAYPWIRWLANSCLHDSFLTLFYLQIYNKDSDSLLGGNPDYCDLLEACLQLENIDQDEVFFNGDDCLRQQLSVQLLRQGNLQMSDVQELKKYFKSEDLYLIFTYDHCHCFNCGLKTSTGLEVIDILHVLNVEAPNQSLQAQIDKTFKVKRQGCNSCNEEDCSEIVTEVTKPPRFWFISLALEGFATTVEEDLYLGVAKYKLEGIIVFKTNHFIAYALNGALRKGKFLVGWWRHDSLDGNLVKIGVNFQDLRNYSYLRGENPHLLLYVLC